MSNSLPILIIKMFILHLKSQIFNAYMKLIIVIPKFSDQGCFWLALKSSTVKYFLCFIKCFIIIILAIYLHAQLNSWEIWLNFFQFDLWGISIVFNKLFSIMDWPLSFLLFLNYYFLRVFSKRELGFVW